MSLYQIIGAIGIIVLFRQFFWPKAKSWLLFILSLFALFLFQTPSSIRALSFWLPNIMLFVAIGSWKIITNERLSKQDLIAALIISVFPFFMYLIKFLGIAENFLILNIPEIINLLGIPLTVFIILSLLKKNNKSREITSFFVILFLVSILIILKNQYLGLKMSSLIRQLNGQTTSLASSIDLTWVGFSYFVFRIIHVLVDRKRLERIGFSLRDFLTYLLFFSAFTSGPIDRADHFNAELENNDDNEKHIDFFNGGRRVVLGLFQKFILADSLAIISLNSYNAQLINKPEWLWVVMYAYAFRIYFDFSGYSDIAIGIAQLAGIKLPENFNRPYLSKNITMFWNNWHITMTQWFRTYYFNPLTRFLKINYKKISPVFILLFVQITTMVLIGLWHGISWNYIIWGVWNGVGLFLHNRWSSTLKPKFKIFKEEKYAGIYQFISTLLTFNYISLGWIWFALPRISDSLLVFNKLF